MPPSSHPHRAMSPSCSSRARTTLRLSFKTRASASVPTSCRSYSQTVPPGWDSGPSRAHGGIGLGLAIVKSCGRVTWRGSWRGQRGPGPGHDLHRPGPPTAGSAEYLRGGRCRARDKCRRHANCCWKPRSLIGLRILAVDDDPDALEVTRHILEGEGAQVLVSSSGDCGLREPPSCAAGPAGVRHRHAGNVMASSLIQEVRRRGMSLPGIPDRLRTTMTGASSWRPDTRSL